MKKFYLRQLLLTLVTIAFSFFILSIMINSSDNQNNAEDLALGKFTSSVYAKLDNNSIHCKGYSDSRQCIESALKSPYPKILWIGNSQLHGINQYQNGQIPAPGILHSLLKDSNKFLITFSFPNASLNEKYFLYRYISHFIDIDTLVIPLIMDDLREGDIRHDIKNISNDVDFYNSLNESEIKEFGKLLEDRANKNDFDGLKNTLQERAEVSLNERLSEYSEIWSKRPQLRAEVFNRLYRLRNTIFNINPSSERKKISSFYKLNISSLKDILDETDLKKTKTILYIAPIRNDFKIPYNIEEYKLFKNHVQEIAKEYNTKLLNLENLVPNIYWGSKASTGSSINDEIDFMHFQYNGHVILSEKLNASIIAEDY